jgi:two-component system chemotaxis sensor kinase CheA
MTCPNTEDEEADSAAPEPVAADPADIEVELEEVAVDEGPIGEESMEFVPDFLTEGTEILDKLDEDLVHLEEASDDLDLLNEIFRAAHTLKGTTSFLGFAQMAELTHKMENTLDLLRKGEMQLNQGIMDVILQGVDQIKLFMGDIRNNNIVRHDIDELRRTLLIISESKGASLGSPAPAPAAVTPAAEEAEAAPAAAAPVAETSAAAPAQAAAGARTPARDVDQVIRVDVERIDQIMTLAEELVLGRNRLLQLNTQLLTDHGEDELINRLNEATGQVGMLTGELQESVMMMRMIPASRVFSRFPRMVRDLARDLSKQIADRSGYRGQ